MPESQESSTQQNPSPRKRGRPPGQLGKKAERIAPDHDALEKIGLRTVERAAQIEGCRPATIRSRGIPILKRGHLRLVRIADHEASLRGEPFPPRRRISTKPIG